MQKQYLFLLALCAVKPDERFIDSVEEDGKTTFFSDGGPEHGYKMSTEVGITPVSVIAPTAKIAKKMGLDIAEEKFPMIDGWLSHTVMIRLMEKKKIKELLTMINWGEPVVDDDDDSIDEDATIMRKLLS